jgi:hypothetical protein
MSVGEGRAGEECTPPAARRAADNAGRGELAASSGAGDMGSQGGGKEESFSHAGGPRMQREVWPAHSFSATTARSFWGR